MTQKEGASTPFAAPVKRIQVRKIVLIVAALFVCHIAVSGYNFLRFRASNLVGRTVDEVLDRHGQPSLSCWLEPEAGQSSPRRVFGPETIDVLKAGGDGDLLYFRYPFQRYGVHIAKGIVTGVDDATR